jgi:hypothetical protein
MSTLPHKNKGVDMTKETPKFRSIEDVKRDMNLDTARSAKVWEASDPDRPHLKGRRLPICPYGCDREGTLLEIVMKPDGRALGIFNDHPCSCIFVADIEVGEPPTKRKMVVGPDGELHLSDGEK